MMFSLTLSGFMIMAGLSEIAEPIRIDSRLELFVDDRLIDTMHALRLKMHEPVPAGKVMDFDLPWDGACSVPNCIFKDGDKYRMYYRAARPEFVKSEPYSLNICYAESVDGIHWIKPSLGLHEFEGSSQNNIVQLPRIWSQSPTLGYIFKDENPAEPPERRYKALCHFRQGDDMGIGVHTSPDGLNWTLWRDEPIITGGPLDSLHIVVWDPDQQLYLAYVRNWVTRSKGFKVLPEIDALPEQYHSWYVVPDRVRAIALTTSKDFLNWSRQQWLVYPEETPIEHLYTNTVTTYFRAPHFYLAFPMRFLPDREVISGWAGSGVARTKGCSDTIFMTSRDGRHWNRRFLESFIRPGLDPSNWTGRNMFVTPGLTQTGPGEISIYYLAHYAHEDCQLRRSTLRLDGFVSVHSDYAGGEFATKPLVFSGKHLVINYSTSAAGSLRVEIQDSDGSPFNGFSLGESVEIVGDQIERVVRWKSGSDVSTLAGKPVRLRFTMKDADLYSIRFRP